MSSTSHPDAPVIDADLVRRLLAAQFPDWAELDVRPVAIDGWDNRTFRVGDSLSARLPSGPGYVPQVDKEVTWLPHLAAWLSIPIPEITGVGEPGAGYPFPWTVRRWIDGTPAVATTVDDTTELARDLAQFLRELQEVDPAGPRPGLHSAYRGGPLMRWDAETRAAIDSLGDRVDADAATENWEHSLGASGPIPEVWFHGDVATGILLMENDRLSAVIDFGCSGVGDPACDLVIAWTFFDEPDRTVFRETLGVDDAQWARGRGWALWKALITLDDPLRAVDATRTLRALGIETNS